MIPVTTRGVVLRASRLFTRHVPQKRTLIFHEVTPRQSARLLALESYIHADQNLEIAWTFDDGFQSSVRMMQQLNGTRATIFVCPEFIQCGERGTWKSFVEKRLCRDVHWSPEMEEQLRPCTWEDLRMVVQAGHIVGSHTLTHVRLSSLQSRGDLEKEIIDSGEMLENRLGVQIRHFAFPFGTADSISTQAFSIIQKRYEQCFTGVRGNNRFRQTSEMQWRDALHPDWPLGQMISTLHGGLDWYYWSRRRTLSRLQVAQGYATWV